MKILGDNYLDIQHNRKAINKQTCQIKLPIGYFGYIQKRYITKKETITHSHGPETAHAHESTAFTLWIDFDLAVKQAASIAKALSRKKPELKDTFQINCANKPH